MIGKNATSPSLSLVLTCYNLSEYVEIALKSVFCQNYKGPMELIIVDDASQDDSVEIIKRCIEEYGKNWDTTLLVNETNLGVAGATDRGWQTAKYEWIIEIDGDDVQCPDRCTRTAELIREHPEVGMIIMSHSCIDSKGKEFARRYMIKDRNLGAFIAYSSNERASIFNGVASAYPVTKGAYGCSMSLKKDIVNQWGPLTAENKKRFAQDPPWELRSFLLAPILWSNEFACAYRMHNTNILNHVRKYETLSDWIKDELERCDYAYKENIAYCQMIHDVHRAAQNVQLTDWCPDQLQQCIDILEKYRLVSKLRYEWWNYNIFKRIVYAFKYSRIVPREYSRWFFNRLLPIKWSIFLKKNRK